MLKKILICATFLCTPIFLHSTQEQETVEINFDDMQELISSVDQQELAQEMEAMQPTTCQACKQKIGNWLFVRYCLLKNYMSSLFTSAENDVAHE